MARELWRQTRRTICGKGVEAWRRRTSAPSSLRRHRRWCRSWQRVPPVCTRCLQLCPAPQWQTGHPPCARRPQRPQRCEAALPQTLHHAGTAPSAYYLPNFTSALRQNLPYRCTAPATVDVSGYSHPAKFLVALADKWPAHTLPPVKRSSVTLALSDRVVDIQDWSISICTQGAWQSLCAPGAAAHSQRPSLCLARP